MDASRKIKALFKIWKATGSGFHKFYNGVEKNVIPAEAGIQACSRISGKPEK